MANFPTASLTINFGLSVVGDEDAILVAEVNPDDNNGQTSFVFGGASPIFRVYASPNITSISCFPSDGSIASAGSGKAQFTENLTFAGFSQTSNGTRDDSYRQANVAKPVTGQYSTLLSVGNIGSVSLLTPGGNTFQCSSSSQSPSSPVVGLARVQYSSNYRKYSLNGVSMPSGFGQGDFDSYPVVIFIVGIVG